MKKATKELRRLAFRNKYLAATISMLLFFSSNIIAQTRPFPNTVNTSNDSSYNNIKGGVHPGQGLISTNYIDTATANLSPIAHYSGAQIFVADTLWIRNVATTKWIPVYTSNGPLPFNDSVYVKPPLYVYIDSLGHQVIAIQQQDGIIGTCPVIWDSLLVFHTPPCNYVIGGNYYSSPFNYITLDSADATNPRYDLFIVDTFSRSTKITGVPSPTPTIPQADPSSQLALTSGFLVNPGDTVPNNLQSISVWDENLGVPTEWALSTTGTLTENANNTDKPKHLTKAIFVSKYNNGSSLKFLSASTDTVKNGQVLSFWIYLNGALNSNYFRISFLKGSTAVTNSLNLRNIFGLNPNDSNVYQPVAIPLSVFNWTGGNVFDGIRIQNVGTDTSGAKGYYLDWITLQTGILPIPSPTDYSNKQDSNSITKTVVGSDTLNVINWWVKGIAHPLAPIYTHSGAVSVNTIYTADDSIRNGDRTVQLHGHGLAFSDSATVTGITISPSFSINGNSLGTDVLIGNVLLPYIPSGAVSDSILTDSSGFVRHENVANLPITWQQTLNPFNAGNELTQTNSITIDNDFNLRFAGNVSDDLLFINNANASGTGVHALGSSAGVFGESSQFGVEGIGDVNGVYAISEPIITDSTSSAAIFAEAHSGSIPIVTSLITGNTDSVKTAIKLQRSGSLIANGIGMSIDYSLPKSISSTTNTTTSIITKLTDVTPNAEKSQLLITGLNSGVKDTILTINGSGQAALPKYVGTNFYGTSNNTLKVDGSGNVIVDTTHSGGGSSVNFAINERFTGSTSTTLTTAHNYTSGTIEIWKNGAKLDPVTDYAEATANTITLIVPRLSADVFLTDYHY